MIQIVEHFLSLSGEAPILGEPTYFYRFSGCNLNCSYCDTLYKNEVNLKLSERDLIADIKKRIKEYPNIKILFTGGEPLLGTRKESLLKIIGKFPKIEFYIETNGTIELPVHNLSNCHFVCDYKSPSSGFTNSFNKNNLSLLHPKRDCIKFVVSEDDFEWLKQITIKIKAKNKELKLYVSPISGKVDLKNLAEYILFNRLPLILSVQLHKIIWPNIERGV